MPVDIHLHKAAGWQITQMRHTRLNIPSDDAASSPHERDGAVVQGPAEFLGCLPQQHKALCVGNDLGGVEGLQRDTLNKSL